jgi:mannose-1-phosphate guanylyltransferase/mannose-6-phosphate isomerase
VRRQLALAEDESRRLFQRRSGMSPTRVLPVIMAGGSGTRLWPLSRAQYPKQFLVLHGNRSLFQQAAARLQALQASDIAVEAPCIVGNEEHRFLILDQLRELTLPGTAIVLEPAARNTAPAMTLAALHALALGGDPVLVVTPADQTVTDADAFGAAVLRAIRTAAGGSIVLLGITPDRPETGFGYIRAVPADRDDGVLRVERFVEKPDLATAEDYLRAGGYFWNSGMFVVARQCGSPRSSGSDPTSRRRRARPGPDAATTRASCVPMPQPSRRCRANRSTTR